MDSKLSSALTTSIREQVKLLRRLTEPFSHSFAQQSSKVQMNIGRHDVSGLFEGGNLLLDIDSIRFRKATGVEQTDVIDCESEGSQIPPTWCR